MFNKILELLIDRKAGSSNKREKAFKNSYYEALRDTCYKAIP